jgi:hypothetical protein
MPRIACGWQPEPNAPFDKKVFDSLARAWFRLACELDRSDAVLKELADPLIRKAAPLMGGVEFHITRQGRWAFLIQDLERLRQAVMRRGLVCFVVQAATRR